MWLLVRRGAIAIAAVCILALSGAGAWAGYLQATGNIHEVEPGQVYRSNQLAPAQMAELLRDAGIRTVINLRGGSREDAWYREEATVVASAGARLIDIPLLDSVEPDATQLNQLLDALRSSPTPILIHCEAGADRSGLAAALYELVIAGKTPEVAAGQLSFAYGHFPWLGSPSAAMDRAFWNLSTTRPLSTRQARDPSTSGSTWVSGCWSCAGTAKARAAGAAPWARLTS